MLAAVLLFVLAVLFCACGGGDAADGPSVTISRKPGPPKTENDTAAESQTDTSDIYIVQLLNTKKEKIFLKNLYTGREFVYKYSLFTDFLDKFGEDTNVTAFYPGRAVSIIESGSDRTLKEVRASTRVWTYDDITNYDLDADRGVLRIGPTNYKLGDDTMVFSDDVEAGYSDIGEGDTLSVIGLDKDILTITITSGHGFLSVVNTEKFEGSMLCVGNKIFARVTSGMTLTVPEGKYKVTAANNGYGGTKKVKIKRGETKILDLKELEGEGPKYCKLIIKSSVPGATIMIDDKEIKEGKKTKVAYGKHALSISVEGYDDWKKVLFVNSESAEITVDPTAAATGNNTTEADDGAEEDASDDASDARADAIERAGLTDSDGDGDYDEEDAEVDYLSTINNMLSNLNTTRNDDD